MPGALIGAGAALIGGAMSADASKDASRASRRANDAAIAEERRQFDTTRADFAPYRQVGTGALGILSSMYGIPMSAAPAQEIAPEEPAAPLSTVDRLRNLFNGSKITGAPQPTTGSSPKPPPTGMPAVGTPGVQDFSAFYNSPDYRFAVDQGQQAIERARSATGNLASGNTLTELTRYGQGMGAQQLNNYTSRLMALAGIGQGATTTTAGLGANMASNVGNLMSASGDSRASGIAGSANAWGNAAGTIGGIAYDYYRNRPASMVPTGGMTHNWSGPGSTRVV
jgi:hypothetical protein